MVQATPDGLFEKQIFSSLPRIKLYKKLILYNGQAGCGKLNCRSSKLSYRKEDLKWAFSQDFVNAAGLSLGRVLEDVSV